MNTTARGWARVGFSLIAAGVAAMMVASPAFAAQGGTPGAPSVSEEEGAGNNLSIPTIYVPSSNGAPLARTETAEGYDSCFDGAVAPTGSTSTYDITDDGVNNPLAYYTQKTDAVWAAACQEATTATVHADWGDNLTLAPQLVTGKTIRVEMALLAFEETGRTGYIVRKLTDQIDRLATYGVIQTATPELPQSFTTTDSGLYATHVWDANATLEIERLDGDSPGVVYSSATDGGLIAEINSMGAIVYGFNWGQKHDYPVDGQYRITFTAPNTDIVGVEDDGSTFNATDHVSLDIQLLPKNGGGGGNSGNHGNPNK